MSSPRSNITSLASSSHQTSPTAQTLGVTTTPGMSSSSTGSTMLNQMNPTSFSSSSPTTTIIPKTSRMTSGSNSTTSSPKAFSSSMTSSALSATRTPVCPASCNNPGVDWTYYYYGGYGAPYFSSDNNWDSTFFRNNSLPNVTSVTQGPIGSLGTVGDDCPIGNTVNIFGYQEGCYYFALEFAGFMYAYVRNFPVSPFWLTLKGLYMLTGNARLLEISLSRSTSPTILYLYGSTTSRVRAITTRTL